MGNDKLLDKMVEYLQENVFNQLFEDEDKKILADFLDDEVGSYTLEAIPTELVYKPYRDGGYLEQRVFQFGSREYYDDSDNQNIDNLAFYDDIEKIIRENNKQHIWPDIKGIQEIECLNNGAIQNEEEGKAKYVIQIRILILKEA